MSEPVVPTAGEPVQTTVSKDQFISISGNHMRLQGGGDI